MHRINLHGPWNLSSADERQKSIRSKYPCWLTQEEFDPVKGFWLCRKFHAPTGIGDSEKIFLEFSVQLDPIEVILNDKPVEVDLGKVIEIDVTGQLNAFNQVCFRFEGINPSCIPDSLFSSARMVIGVSEH